MLKPEAIDALTRLRKAIEGRQAVHGWNKNQLTVSSAEVNPRDIVDLCKDLPENPRTQSLQSGTANALELIPEIRTVALHVVDIVHLIREAEKLIPPTAAPVAPPVGSPPLAHPEEKLAPTPAASAAPPVAHEAQEIARPPAAPVTPPAAAG